MNSDKPLLHENTSTNPLISDENQSHRPTSQNQLMFNSNNGQISNPQHLRNAISSPQIQPVQPNQLNANQFRHQIQDNPNSFKSYSQNQAQQKFAYQPPQFGVNQQYEGLGSNQPPAFFVNKAPFPPRKIRTRISRQEATRQGQFYCCQRCGSEGFGTVDYKAGKTACLWGTGLLMFTCIFFWIPCTCRGCKDIQIYCGRCGYKKAIVPAQCCC